MAKKVSSGNTTVSIDNAAGALKVITTEVREVGGLDRVWDVEDVTALSDTEMRNFKVFPQGAELTFTGMYDNGSSSADVHFRGLINLQGTSSINTVTVSPDGTRSYTTEAALTTYRYIVANKLVVGYEAVFTSDNGVTIT